ncbi:unnamed protein product [Vicia faba]|uniref:Uncharacterized protein n=1 Tax=Vicia faba TaxID=3906 RepID=A0AAV0YHE4_VICFA|nr:unnamed protein product [Vicia faba]
MIYGSTGATHFDQLSKILTGYEITSARSSGIFMGILSVAVGSLFKITAVPFRAAVERTTAYRCQVQKTQLNHATHVAGVLPAREERRATRFSSDLTVCSMGADYPKNPREQFKKRYLSNENNRGLYWRDPTVNSCPKEKPPGSPRTFSTVTYPQTSSLCAKQDRPCPFSIPPPSLLCSNIV